ncbi:MAG: hypothetical protein M3O70_23295 [Actinomycetota bacterium]|nr:hypothetical protein [Actinomycetota bacterium]
MTRGERSMRGAHPFLLSAMKIRRLVAAGLVGAAIASAVFAAAANLGVGTETLGGGGTAVTSCDSGFTTTYEVPTTGDSAFLVTGVTVGDIAPSCVGGLMKVVVVDSSDASIGSGQVTVPDASSVAVSLTPAADPAAVVGVHIVVVGGS